MIKEKSGVTINLFGCVSFEESILVVQATLSTATFLFHVAMAMFCNF